MKLAKIRIEDIQAEVAKDGWTLISTEYKNLNTILEFECDEHHKVFAPWSKLRTRRECPICAKNDFKLPNFETIPKKNAFRVLGLDQATKVSGFSIYDNKKLVKYGIFRAPEGVDEIARDHVIKEWLISIIKAFDIDYVGIEGIQYEDHYGVTTFQTLARLQGILMETVYDLGIPYKICPTNTWRAHCGVKGRSRSDKKASMISLTKQWYDVTVSDDCADAIGIGRYTADTSCPKIEMTDWE